MKWILGALVLLIAGAIFQLGLLVYAMYALLAVLLASRYLAWQWTTHLVASRQGRLGTAEIGDSTQITVSLRNQGRSRIAWLLAEDSLPLEAMTQQPPGVEVEGKTLVLAQLGAGNQIEMTYRVRFLMRGYYQFGPFLVETGDLFGLHRRYRVVTDPGFVLVYPRIVPLQGYNLASRRPLGEVRLSHRLFEDPTRIVGLRPYQAGDPLNRIHWRATARTGILHSKIYEPSCVAGATLVLDFHQSSYRVHNGRYRAELAVTAAASIAHAIYRMGEQIGLMTNGRDAAERIQAEGWRTEFRTRALAKAKATERGKNDRLQPISVETRKGEGQLRRILETLARLEITDGFDFPELLGEIACRLPRDATVIAILPEVTEAIAIALGNLRRRGYAVTAVLVMFGEVEYFDWAAPPEWAGRLLGEGVDFRRIDDEQTLAALCAEQFVQ